MNTTLKLEKRTSNAALLRLLEFGIFNFFYLYSMTFGNAYNPMLRLRRMQQRHLESVCSLFLYVELTRIGNIQMGLNDEADNDVFQVTSCFNFVEIVYRPLSWRHYPS